MNSEKDIALKAWDTYQGLIAGLSETSWKIRSVYYTASFGVIAAAFSSDLPYLYLLNPILSILFCLLEAGYQQIQQQYLEKTNNIEVTINDMLTQEAEVRWPDSGITTSLEPPTLSTLGIVFTRKKYLFWSSYLIVSVFSLILFFTNLTKSRLAPPASPCPTVCCPCPPSVGSPAKP
jgi:hypothetical protein